MARDDGTTWRYLPDGAAVGIALSLVVQRWGHACRRAVVSATHDAHASIRSMAQCMAMGQAAGTTAALADARLGDVVRSRSRRVLDRLRAEGANPPARRGGGVAA